MRIKICKKFFDINVIFFFSGKNIFWGVFFMSLNLVISQKVIKIFEKLFLHLMLKINCVILALKNFQFENLDLYHLPAHCAATLTDITLKWRRCQIINKCFEKQKFDSRLIPTTSRVCLWLPWCVRSDEKVAKGFLVGYHCRV